MTKTVHVSQFANLQPSFMNYCRTELTTQGKYWINLQKNKYIGTKKLEQITIDILTGKDIKMDFGK